MKQSKVWLLALLSILTLAATSTLAIAEEISAQLSGKVEIGASAVDIKDNPARVNEYSTYRPDDGINFAPTLNLGIVNKDLLLDLESETRGRRDQEHSLEFDLKRVLRLDLNYQVFEHWKDHETLDQMGATGRGDTGGGQPSVTTDKIIADLAENGLPTTVGGGNLNYDPREAYQMELANDYIVTRREYENEMELALPFIPNVVFHAGLRVEEREGLEQAIGVTKCDNCHVSAAGKEIDETTEDFIFGATGKFGMVTVNYEYLDREFTENGATPSRFYEDAGNPTAYNLLYEADEFPFARTPDSEKRSHSLRARVELPSYTSVTGSYVNSEVESSKAETQGEYELLDGDTLKTEFDSFGGKVATRLGNLRLSLRGSMQEIEVDSNQLYFSARDPLVNPQGASAWPGDATVEWHSAEAREVTELGIDGVYRLSRGTTLSLGYEYEEVDREEDELGDTETHTLKAAVKARLYKKLSGRLSYQYQDIDEPFAGAHIGIAQGDPAAIQDITGDPNLWYYSTLDFSGGDSTKTWYWTDVYPNRQLSSTNQPEEVHEAKGTATWSINPNMAATVFARLRMEENNEVNYEQTTFVPGASLWYTPNGKMNLTMAYNFNKQETENQMCVGWYHG